MAFNKLLLVFALAALSFGAKRKVKDVEKETDVPKHDPEIITWSKPGSWDKEGLYKSIYGCDLDYGQGYTVLNKTKIKKDADEGAASYLAITADQVGSLKIGRAKTLDEYLGYSGKCGVFKYLFGADFYSFPWTDIEHIGYAAYFRDEDDDFFPSFAYNVYNQPRKYYNDQNDVDGTKYRYIEQIDQNCHRGYPFSYFEESIYNFGIVSEECFGNDLSKLPGWGVERKFDERGNDYHWSNGTAEKPEDKCTGDGKFKRYLKGYKFGTLYGGDLTTLKKAIVRFGPVQVSYTYLKPDSDSTSYDHPGYSSVGTYRSGFVIGWNATDLISVANDVTVTFTDATPVYTFKPKRIALESDGVNLNLKYTRTEDGKDVTYDKLYFSYIKIFGNGISVVRVALSVIAAAVVLPALALFF